VDVAAPGLVITAFSFQSRCFPKIKAWKICAATVPAGTKQPSAPRRGCRRQPPHADLPFVGSAAYVNLPATPSTTAMSGDGEKCGLGGVIAGSCLVFSLVVQVIANFFPEPVISIPISTIGSFIFPFVLFNIMWNSMQKNKKIGEKKA